MCGEVVCAYFPALLEFNSVHDQTLCRERLWNEYMIQTMCQLSCVQFLTISCGNAQKLVA